MPLGVFWILLLIALGAGGIFLGIVLLEVMMDDKNKRKPGQK